MNFSFGAYWFDERHWGCNVKEYAKRKPRNINESLNESSKSSQVTQASQVKFLLGIPTPTLHKNIKRVRKIKHCKRKFIRNLIKN